MALRIKYTVIHIILLLNFLVNETKAEGLRLPDQKSKHLPEPTVSSSSSLTSNDEGGNFPNQYLQQDSKPQAIVGEERGLASWLSGIFSLDAGKDPYLARTSDNCLNGDLGECFKMQTLQSFDEIFHRNSYRLSDFASIVRMSESQQRSLLQEPLEYSEEPRQGDDDWQQMYKYVLRKVERFIKSTALEVEIPDELTESSRYEARFLVNDIDSELDIIEDKHAPILKRKRLKKLIIPLLLVLKIFKLKLLLFLPFILGIAGLKKILGLTALILPVVFAYFKLCRPSGYDQTGNIFSGLFGSNNFPEYSPQGVGPATVFHQPQHRPNPHFSKPYQHIHTGNPYVVPGNSVSFHDGPVGSDIAYSSYYGRSNNKDIDSNQTS